MSVILADHKIVHILDVLPLLFPATLKGFQLKLITRTSQRQSRPPHGMATPSLSLSKRFVLDRCRLHHRSCIFVRHFTASSKLICPYENAHLSTHNFFFRKQLYQAEISKRVYLSEPPCSLCFLPSLFISWSSSLNKHSH